MKGTLYCQERMVGKRNQWLNRSEDCTSWAKCAPIRGRLHGSHRPRLLRDLEECARASRVASPLCRAR
jgi:hypothetical protein